MFIGAMFIIAKNRKQFTYSPTGNTKERTTESCKTWMTLKSIVEQKQPDPKKYDFTDTNIKI